MALSPPHVFLGLTAVLLCLTTAAVGVTRFPDGSHQICSFIEKIRNRCAISITGPNAPLFRDSYLRDVIQTCRHNGTLSTEVTSANHELLVDIMTYISVTRHCGLIIRAEQVPDPAWIVEVIAKVLSWSPGIESQNCQQLKEFTTFLTDNIARVFDKLDSLFLLLQSLEPDLQKAILPILPGKLCELVGAVNIPLFVGQQVTRLVDNLKADCHSGTTLGTRSSCTWRDSQSIYIPASADTDSQLRVPNVCIPSEAGKQCPIDRKCIKVLCQLDYNIRNCSSPCVKAIANTGHCTREEPRHPCEGSPADVQSVALPDPRTATADELSAVACCLVKRRREASMYPDDVLCNITAPVNSTCMKAFTKWQISRAPKCERCNDSNHVSALLSPTCQQFAVKMIPTTTEEVLSLTNVTMGRNMLLKLYRHIYGNLDELLENLVCLQFMQVVTVDNFKKLGIDRLEPMLFTMAECPDHPPPVAKVLAIMIKGETCPITQLKTSATDLIRIGAITDRCFDSLKPSDALDICTILMTDRKPQISKRKIQLMCKLLEKLGDTTCIFCPLKINRLTRPTEADQPTAKIRAERCLGLQTLDRSALTSEHLRELQQCKMCQESDKGSTQGANSMDPYNWCGRNDELTKEDVENSVGNICDLFSARDGGDIPAEELCRQQECFIKKAVNVITKNNITVDSFSILGSMGIFLPIDKVNGTPTFPCTKTYRLCPYVHERLRLWLGAQIQTTVRGRRQVTCDTPEVVRRARHMEVKHVPGILKMEDLECLTPEAAWNMVTDYSLNLDDWTPTQARVLVDKIVIHVGKRDTSELSVDELRALGLLLVSLSPEEIGQLKVVDSITIGLLGSSPHWTRAQKRAWVLQYMDQEERTPDILSVDDVLVLQNLVEGFSSREAGAIPTESIKETSAVLGSLQLCDPVLITVLIDHLKTAHGNVSTWDESQMAEYSNLLGGLTVTEINTLGPTVVSHIPDHVWLYHTDEDKYNALLDTIKEAVPEYQQNLALKDESCEETLSGFHRDGTGIGDKIPTSVSTVAPVAATEAESSTKAESGGSRPTLGLMALLFCILLRLL